MASGVIKTDVTSAEGLSATGETIIDNAMIFRNGKVRIIRIAFKSLVEGNNSSSAGFIPALDRPKFPMVQDCVSLDGSTYRVTIEGGGTIQIYRPGSSVANPNMYASIMYFTN